MSKAMPLGIRIDNSVLTFTQPQFAIGQRVKFIPEDEKPRIGFIIGIAKSCYGWSYYVVEGNPPNSQSEEFWADDTKVQPLPLPQQATKSPVTQTP